MSAPVAHRGELAPSTAAGWARLREGLETDGALAAREKALAMSAPDIMRDMSLPLLPGRRPSVIAPLVLRAFPPSYSVIEFRAYIDKN